MTWYFVIKPVKVRVKAVACSKPSISQIGTDYLEVVLLKILPGWHADAYTKRRFGLTLLSSHTSLAQNVVRAKRRRRQTLRIWAQATVAVVLIEADLIANDIRSRGNDA